MSGEWFKPRVDAGAIREPVSEGDAMLRAAGFNITEEGEARARKRRLDAAARHTPELWAAWRAQLGLPNEAE